jgi:tetraacyldisaccharide 4'-kinase
MPNWRRLLFPLSLIFGIIIRLRNLLYDYRILKSTSFPVATIGVGNLSTGGTGKTPHIEYLIRLLKNDYRTATLSRGYGRNTKGFLMAKENCDASIIGDEPMQYFSKFNGIDVAVGESRKHAMEQLLNRPSRPQVILLDDNYQHRQVKAGLQILLISYENIEKDDMLLPAGNLREPISGIKRADIIIISKTPAILVPIERKRLRDSLELHKRQSVFFTFYKYGEFHRLHGKNDGMMMGADYYMANRFTIFLVCGIADPGGILEYLKRHTSKLETLIFPDHHAYTEEDLTRIREKFESIVSPNKIIVTTEKDAMRFKQPGIDVLARLLPFFYLPIEVAFHQDGNLFDEAITAFVQNEKNKN